MTPAVSTLTPPPPAANARSEQKNKQTRDDPLNFGPCKADWPAAFVIK